MTSPIPRIRHPGPDPESSPLAAGGFIRWIPAFAGMTELIWTFFAEDVSARTLR